MTVCMRQMTEVHGQSLGNMQKAVEVSTKVCRGGGGGGGGGVRRGCVCVCSVGKEGGVCAVRGGKEECGTGM